MTAAVSIVDAISDPALLGAGFIGPSWDTWRAVLRAAFALPMMDDDIDLFRGVAGREPPRKQVRELWIVAGRRSGKDSIASVIAAYGAGFGDYRSALRPGERALVSCLAVDRQQSKIVLSYIKAFFSNNPMLSAMVERETADGLELSNEVEIAVQTNSFRAVRGRSIVLAIFDEVAFWLDDNSTKPDVEIYRAIRPGLATVPGAMLIGISSPYKRSDLLWERYRKYYGSDSDDVLVIKAPTAALNPTIDPAIIAEAIEEDPEAAGAEWLAEFRSDLADFVRRETLDAATITGRRELPPVPGLGYMAFVDPSGGSADSMTLAIAHMEADGRGVLDLTREVKPPFGPAAVVADFAAVLAPYGIGKVRGDRYGAEWVAERFRDAGIGYEASELSRSELYLELLPLLNSGRVELLDDPRLINQLASLERRTARAGRDSVDHPPHGHDDLANSVAGALVAVTMKTRASGWLAYAAEIVEERKNPQAVVKNAEPKMKTIPLHASPIIEVKWTKTEDELPQSGTFIEISADGQRPSGKVQFHPGAWIPPYWKKVVQ